MDNIVPKETVIKQLLKNYPKDELDVIFAYHIDHPIIQEDNGTYRWKQKLEWQKTPGMDPNTISIKYQEGKMTQEEYMAYNRDIGYSLYGYWEVFVFNDNFNDEQYEKDMIEKKREERSEKIEVILK